MAEEYTGLGLAGVFNLVVTIIGVAPSNDMEHFIVYAVAAVLTILAIAAVFILFMSARRIYDRLFQ